MPELHIKNLKCVKKQDTVGKDSAILRVNGATVSGPHLLGKGDDVTLNTLRTFTSSISVTLIEEDAGADDDLGTVTITDSQAGIGTLTAFFNARTHADYHMTYDVHS
ncbi:hypothetical protein ACIA5G_43985 [Amycolatopsis sp. NPDC051758]|uniref:hypothetical protein n=1 Tax=Amycolatopsis sp. NPDC051758 TaxID=3363935 RepID=UPI0037BC6AD3